MPKYLIGSNDSSFEEGNFVIIDASSRVEAEEKYIRQVGISDEYFRDYLADRSINGGFASHFWLQTGEENDVWNSEMRLIIDEQEFKRRIREFFEEWPGYADLYLEYYDNTNDSAPVPNWPEEFLVMIWKMSETWDSFSVFSIDEIPMYL